MNTSSAPVQGENATIHKKRSSFNSYLWILSFLKPYAWMVSGFIMLSLFVIGVELAVPKFLQYFIDVLIPAKNFSKLVWSIGCACRTNCPDDCGHLISYQVAADHAGECW